MRATDDFADSSASGRPGGQAGSQADHGTKHLGVPALPHLSIHFSLMPGRRILGTNEAERTFNREQTDGQCRGRARRARRHLSARI